MKKILFLSVFFPSILLADIHHPPTHVVPDGGSDFYGYFYLATITGSNTTTNNNDGTYTVSCGGVAPTRFLLVENGGVFLFEDGTKLVLE